MRCVLQQSFTKRRCLAVRTTISPRHLCPLAIVPLLEANTRQTSSCSFYLCPAGLYTPSVSSLLFSPWVQTSFCVSWSGKDLGHGYVPLQVTLCDTGGRQCQEASGHGWTREVVAPEEQRAKPLRITTICVAHFWKELTRAAFLDGSSRSIDRGTLILVTQTLVRWWM